jgi:hypothetical protein
MFSGITKKKKKFFGHKSYTKVCVASLHESIPQKSNGTTYTKFKSQRFSILHPEKKCASEIEEIIESLSEKSKSGSVAEEAKVITDANIKPVCASTKFVSQKIETPKVCAPNSQIPEAISGGLGGRLITNYNTGYPFNKGNAYENKMGDRRYIYGPGFTGGAMYPSFQPSGPVITLEIQKSMQTTQLRLIHENIKLQKENEFLKKNTEIDQQIIGVLKENIRTLTYLLNKTGEKAYNTGSFCPPNHDDATNPYE